MDTLQISNVLSRDIETKKVFRGCFPRDELLLLNYDNPSLYVVNSDSSRNPGSHWVGIYIDRENKATYFDSFGCRPIHREFYIFLRMNSIACTFNSQTVQTFTNVCGQHVLLFSLMIVRDYSLRQILDMYSEDLFLNDILVHDFIEDNYNIDVPFRILPL